MPVTLKPGHVIILYADSWLAEEETLRIIAFERALKDGPVSVHDIFEVDHSVIRHLAKLILKRFKKADLFIYDGNETDNGSIIARPLLPIFARPHERTHIPLLLVLRQLAEQVKQERAEREAQIEWNLNPRTYVDLYSPEELAT